MLDVQKAREQTPGCQHVLHLNNAGASLIPHPVIDAVNSHFKLEVEQGGYEASALAESKIQNFYLAASRLIDCHPSEIAFIESATRAWDMIFYSLDFKAGDKILTAVAEYASNYIAFLQMAKKNGIVIEVIPNDAYGQLSLIELRNRIDDPLVKLVAITHVPTHGGLINPAEEVGEITNRANVFYLLDATQSIGQFPVNVNKLKCDALCATGRKYLRGPRGTGFLFINEKKVEDLDPPFLDLQAARWISKNEYKIHPNAQRFETWETNYSNKIGLGVAIDYALSWGIENIWTRISHLGQFLRSRLTEFSQIQVQDLGEKKCGIVTFNVKNLTAQDVCSKLRAKKINVSVSLAEYARLDMDERGLQSLVRASVHYFNTEEEIETFCLEMEKIFV
jgi:cysteine desulfurase / selenocysteine lyase